MSGGWGPSSALTVEAPGQFHTVAWNGQPPPAMAELVSEVERLAGAPATPVSPARVPAALVVLRRRRSGAARQSSLAVLGGVVVLVAAAVVVTLLLVGNKKPVPGVPGNVTVTAGRGEVIIHWNPGSGKVDHYVVYQDGHAIGSQTAGSTTLLRQGQRHRDAQLFGAGGEPGRADVGQSPLRSRSWH